MRHLLTGGNSELSIMRRQAILQHSDSEEEKKANYNENRNVDSKIQLMRAQMS